MQTHKLKKALAILLATLSLSACKIDMTVNGDGNVKTDAGTFDCSTGTSGDCTQSYVTDVTQCPSYVAPVEDPVTHITPPPTIPPNCAVLVATNANCSTLFANDH